MLFSVGFYFKNYGRNFDGLAFRWEEETLSLFFLSLSLKMTAKEWEKFGQKTSGVNL